MTRKTNGQKWGKEMGGLCIIFLLKSIAPDSYPLVEFLLHIQVYSPYMAYGTTERGAFE